MEIPGLGIVEDDDDSYVSDPVTVPVLGDAECQFIVVGYDDDDAQEDFHTAIDAFLALDASTLRAAAPSVFAYYQDVRSRLAGVGIDRVVAIDGPDDVWDHVEFGWEVTIERDWSGDRQVCLSIGSSCAWEPEHGLQIVFRGGRTVTKVGPFDGHLSNASAYGRDELADVVYHRRRAVTDEPPDPPAL
ncbi:hypothetical protein ABT282_05325 [Streptomyces sp. NPDC000927]|uniref:DUF6985 domain-containing protein n=1 Tax=unclassified Streptomyces TaxID=2593676 RepID=UPI00331D4FD4